MLIDERGHDEAARLHEQAARIADTDRALAEVLGQVPTVTVRGPGPAPRRRRWPILAAAAALLGVVAGGVVLVARDRDGKPPIGGPSTTIDQPPVATSTPSPATTVATSPAPTVTSTPPDATGSPTTVSPGSSQGAVDPDEEWTAVAERDDIAWEATAIPYECGEVEQQQTTQTRCTQVQIDPSGVPVTFDPVTRVVTRGTRGGGPVSFTLPDEYVDASLLAAGPDDIAYFTLDNPWPTGADVLAVSVAPADAGTVIQRIPEVTGLGVGDGDLYAAPQGLVLSDWYATGLRPNPGAEPYVEWIRRDGDATGTFTAAGLDDAANTVQVGDRTWTLGDRLVAPTGPADQTVLATFDGGFIAWYHAYPGGGVTEVMRGYLDGSVQHRLLPWIYPLLAPDGTLLLPDGDHFVRLAPFPAPSDGWDGRLEIDVAAGTAEAVGRNELAVGRGAGSVEEMTLNEFLDGVIAGLDVDSPWASASPAFADAVAGPTSSPAELRTVRVSPAAGATVTAVVVTEGFLDDSVYGERLVIHLDLSGGTPRVERIEWANACQPGRGHQDYRAERCT